MLSRFNSERTLTQLYVMVVILKEKHSEDTSCKLHH